MKRAIGKQLAGWASAVVVGGVLGVSSLCAQTPVPAQSTGQCNDGSYTTAAKKWQACAGHKGVKSWFADSKTAPAAGAPATTPAGATTAPAKVAAPSAKAGSAPGGSAPAVTSGTSSAAAAGKSGLAMPTRTAAAGGGPGMVWVNTDTKVYHCPGSSFYGKTKTGKYMTEADAKAAGDRPNRGQACTK